MADTKREYVNFALTEAVPTAFMNVVNPVPFKKGGVSKGDPRYSATFVFAPDSGDLKALKALIVDKMKAFFPGKKLVSRRLTQDELDGGGVVEVKLPWADGTKFADEGTNGAEKRDNEWARGKVMVKAGSNDQHPPGLSAIENGKVVEFNTPESRAANAGKFASGAYVVAQFGLNIYPAKGETPGGCSLWPRAICHVKPGPKTTGGGGVNQAEVFRAYAGTVKADNPYAGADDEIPF